MFRKQLLILFLICWTVVGLKLNGRAEGSNNDELKVINSDVTKNHSTSWEKSVKNVDVVSAHKNRHNSHKLILNLDDLVVWSPYILQTIWNPYTRKLLNVSVDCEKDITEYIAALRTEQQWVLKLIDATGRYTWGLLSGNIFWLGAADQCRELERKFINWHVKGKPSRQDDVPPFRVRMSSATLNLSIRQPRLNETYRIIFGLCLPDSCNVRDIENLLYFVQDQRGNDSSAKITIETIRNLSKEYSFADDPVFYVLAYVQTFLYSIVLILCNDIYYLRLAFSVVVVFVILGTFYDISLRYRVLRTVTEGPSLRTVMTEMKMLNESPESVDRQITMAKLWSVKEHNSSLDIYSSENVPNPLSEALLSFSVLLNLSKIFSQDVGVDTLAPIHGLRFLSMIWVILVHTCLTVNVVSDGKTFKENAENEFLYQTLSNGTYAVDTFFFISGCLVSFLYFRTITKDNLRKKKMIRGKCGKVLQFLGMVWYRYFRLTPVYLLVIGLIEVSMSWYYHYTMLDLYTIDYQNCRKFWWRNALYINTYFAMDERCIIWSWYLANDTLFYIIGSIILIIGGRYLSVAGIVTISILIASWITTAAISFKLQHVPSMQDPFAHYESLYDKPWSRIGPYLFGMIAGWYLYKCNCTLKINKTIALVFWSVSFIGMISIVYGLYGNTLNPFLSAIYTALSHSGWAAFVAWILIACVTGHGGVVNKILSWKCLYPLSRLTYCAYLVHPAIIRAVVLQGESSMHLTHGFLAILFIGFTIASYAVSLFISLFFEAPMVSLLRILHPLRQWKKSK